MTAAASRRLIVLDTEPGSFIAGSLYCRIAAADSTRFANRRPTVRGDTMFNPLSRREVLRFGAFTTVGGVLTLGVSLAQAIVTDTKGIVARDVQLSVGGTSIPPTRRVPRRRAAIPSSW